MGAFYPFKPCRTCTGETVAESHPAHMLSEAPATPSETSGKDIFPVDTTEEADPAKVLPAKNPLATEGKDANQSFLTTPTGAILSVGGVALFVGYLLSNLGTTRGKPSFT